MFKLFLIYCAMVTKYNKPGVTFKEFSNSKELQVTTFEYIQIMKQ